MKKGFIGLLMILSVTLIVLNGISVLGQEIVKEQVKCVFEGSTTSQSCYSGTPGIQAGCQGIETCVADVSGTKGQVVTWKSTCGGYATTTIDGINEYAYFKCDTQPPVCGNGVIDTGEQCDGTNFGKATCQTLGYIGGTLKCSNCQFDTSGCQKPTGTGNLVVTSVPNKASLYVDDFTTQKGTTPKTLKGLCTGTHHVKVSKTGYCDYVNCNVVINAGKNTPINAKLTKPPVGGSCTTQVCTLPAPTTFCIPISPPKQVCKDTDGKDIYKVGVTTGPEAGTGKKVVKKDYCVTEGEKAGRLNEFLCNLDGYVVSQTFGPEDGCNLCKNGKCVTTPVQGGQKKVTQPTCIDSDINSENPYYVKGVTRDSNGKKIDYCIDSVYLNEYFCNTNQAIGGINIQCTNGCKKGACIK